MTVKKTHGKTALLIGIAVAIISTATIYFGIVPHKRSPETIRIDGIYLTEPKEISNFQLVDNTGQPFTKENLKGHWTLMFFGFTNCGYVCPSTLAALNKMYRTLQEQLPDKQLPQVVMVTVDPERDSVKRMNSYVKSFNQHFIGLRGESSDIERLEKEFHLVAVKLEVQGQGKDHYTIDHSAEIIVINPANQLQAFMSFPHKPEQMVKDYQLILTRE